MAQKNKTIVNRITGQTIKFLQTAADTNGALLEMESSYNPRSMEPVPHSHPHQDEYFRVISGEVKARMKDGVRTLKTGDTIHIPRNTVHSMWNEGDEKAIVNWQVKPAMTTEYLIETNMGLVNDGKSNEKGMPTLMQTALTANKFSDVIRIAKPPYAVQKILFGILTPFAVLKGLKAYYPKYITTKDGSGKIPT